MCFFSCAFPFGRFCFLHVQARRRCCAVAYSYVCRATGEPCRAYTHRHLAHIRRSRLDDSPTMMNTLARRLLAASPLLLIAACSSTPPPGAASSAAANAAAGNEPMIYVSSTHSASSIASCLEGRLRHVHASKSGNATELSVGSRSDASYLVTLTPSGYGSVIRVVHGTARSDDPPEPEFRFDVARCAT